ncbi:Cytochrome c556 [Rhizobium sp. RU35A]|uniref:Cytochrome C556 n=1 Tax=Rhizobium straminoryzae TaxID=1387186 RepID=A0A549T320_9HYPH|nr:MULTISPECIES: cytochrome c [Rhizobium]TRL36279.1 cytochrome C556 [Rhizobium straminoryzae]SIP95370.1 Cytochrome c556 [Rhizobium sp. RU35A]
MKFKLVTTGILALCLGVGAVYAADAPQVVRQGLMKKIGGSMGALGAIAKGQKPYDAATVKTSLSTIAESAKDFPNHFPAGSETGNDTEAAPAIWQNTADFKAKAEKLSSDAQTILASMPTDQAGVGQAVQTLGAECGVCHQAYRLKR